jgi:MFS family permease
MIRSANLFSSLPIFYGWIIMAVTFITMSIAVNARTAFLLLFPAILEKFQWDRSVISGAFSIGFIESSFFVPVVGLLMDRWWPRAVIPMGAILLIPSFYLTGLFADVDLKLAFLFLALVLVQSYSFHGFRKSLNPAGGERLVSLLLPFLVDSVLLFHGSLCMVFIFGSSDCFSL